MKKRLEFEVKTDESDIFERYVLSQERIDIVKKLLRLEYSFGPM